MGRPRNKHYVRAAEPFSGDIDGEPFVVNPVEILADDHPIVQKYTSMFRPLSPSRNRPEVEQATVNPGEARGAVA